MAKPPQLSLHHEAPHPDDKMAVTLPCSFSDFGDFIRSLLGKPQAITNFITGSFDLNRDSISELYHAINDRVTQQNKTKLHLFSIRIIYDDGSTVELNSFESFREYNEIKPVVSVGAHLTWEYLITFEDRSAPERQRINVSATTRQIPSHYDMAMEFGAGRLRPIPTSIETKSGIGYRIEHTARSWGGDIDALLTATIRNLMPTVSAPTAWLRKYGDVALGFLTFALLAYTSTQGISGYYNSRKASLLAELKNASRGVEVHKKLDAIIDLLASPKFNEVREDGISAVLLCVLISAVAGSWVGAKAFPLPPSFLALTRKSEEHKAETLRKRERGIKAVAGAVIVSIALAIAGNWLYDLYFAPLLPK